MWWLKVSQKRRLLAGFVLLALAVAVHQQLQLSLHTSNTEGLLLDEKMTQPQNSYQRRYQAAVVSDKHNANATTPNLRILKSSVSISNSKNNSNNKHANKLSGQDNPREHPPMEFFLKSNETRDVLIADPSPLLDFAYIGHSKCGSSSLLKWFQQHPQLFIKSQEVKIMQKGPEHTVRTIYERYPKNADDEKIHIGYKNSADIYLPQVMQLFQTHFHQTKLMVGIRHPVLWFESFYNFRTIDRPKGKLPKPMQLLGPCVLDAHVCTDHARFHLQISQLGKTPMATQRELQLLQTNLPKKLLLFRNPVFIYETGQLSDPNSTRDGIFRKDLAHFLGVSKMFPPVPQVKPEMRLSSRRFRQWGNYTIDICDAVYDGLRRVLMLHARDTADWMQEFLLKSDQVIVSSRDHFHQLLESYRQDPCDERMPDSDGETINKESLVGVVANTATSVTNESNPYLQQRPPIETILANNGTHEYLIGNPSFLLDFAHIGHSKCGTSSFLAWFHDHPEMYTKKVEDKVLWNGPVAAVKQLYQYPHDGRMIGYKKPRDILLPHVMETLRIHFTRTKLLVGVRHPVLWFQSFFNFRVLDRPQGVLKDANVLIGPCLVDEHVCTDHARFHLQVARLGKTAMTSKRELQLLGNETFPKFPNPVFFYETGQLSDKNESRSLQFRQNLATFLGLSKDIPPAPRVRPEERLSEKRFKARTKYQIDICDDHYTGLREVLMLHARDTADWIQTFLLKSEEVFVSSREYVHELLDSYRKDPCDDRNKA